MKNLILAALMLICSVAFSQITPPVNATTSYTLTSGQTTNFYDPNGPGGSPCATGTTASGSYDNCGCFTTVTINAAAGEFLDISFNEFSMWNTTSGWDWMSIHDGSTIASPVLFDNSSGGPDNPIGDCGIGTNILDFCSIGNSLTFRFYATSVVNRAGWDATVKSISSSCNSTLPIELINFECHDDKESNVITWSTASEINNDYFTLERSEDGIHWHILDVIDGAGNSSQQLNYKSIDSAPYISYTYYRLTQTDFDGKFEYSDVCVTQNESSIFYTYMKPEDNTTIYLSSPYIYQFYNSMGQVVRSGEDYRINVSGLPGGIYILQINSYTQKFILR